VIVGLTTLTVPLPGEAVIVTTGDGAMAVTTTDAVALFTPPPVVQKIEYVYGL
jgi:hypothetical protein